MQVGDNLHGEGTTSVSIHTKYTNKMHEDPETNSDTCTDMGCRTASVSIHLSCSPRFHLLPPRKQYLAEAPPFPIYRAFRDHSPPNAAIPSSHAPRIPTFSACRVAASNRTRDRTNVSPLVQTNACSVRCSPRGTPHRPP